MKSELHSDADVSPGEHLPAARLRRHAPVHKRVIRELHCAVHARLHERGTRARRTDRR